MTFSKFRNFSEPQVHHFHATQKRYEVPFMGVHKRKLQVQNTANGEGNQGRL